jgi:hypothetical protein
MTNGVALSHPGNYVRRVEIVHRASRISIFFCYGATLTAAVSSVMAMSADIPTVRGRNG